MCDVLYRKHGLKCNHWSCGWLRAEEGQTGEEGAGPSEGRYRWHGKIHGTYIRKIGVADKGLHLRDDFPSGRWCVLLLLLTTRCACGPEFISPLAFSTDFHEAPPVVAWTVAVAAINAAAALGPHGSRRMEKDVTFMSEQIPVDRNRLCKLGLSAPLFPAGAEAYTSFWGS